MPALSLVLLLKLLAFAAAAGLGTKAAAWAMNKIPRVNIHTKSALVDKLVNTLANGAIDVAKAGLSHADLDGLLAAMASGTPIGVALGALLPGLEAATIAAAPQAAGTVLASLLGQQQAADRISAVVKSAVVDLVNAHRDAGNVPQPGQVVQLASKRLLVVPHGQAIPDGAKLIASLPAAA